MRKFGNEKISEWFFENPREGAFLISVGCFLLFFLLFTPRFETNDDVRQAMIASGVGITDQADPHILFPNFVLGDALSFFYEKLPHIPFYGIMLYLGLFAGIYLLVNFLLVNKKSPWIWLLWVMLPLSLNVQYTGVAFLLAMGALFQLFGQVTSLPVISFKGLFIASLIRWEAFLLAILLYVGGAFLNKKAWFYGGQKRILILLAIAFAVFAHYAHTNQYDQESEGWENFRKENALRAEITDYDHIPFNTETEALYQEIGWDQSAFQLYQSWFLADKKVHDIEKVKKLVEAKKWHWAWNAERLKKRMRALWSQNLFAGLLMIPICLLFFQLNKKHKKIFLILFLFAASLLLYLAFARWLHNRVSLPVMAFLLFFICLLQHQKYSKKLQIALLCFSLLYFSGFVYRNFQEKKRMDLAIESISSLPTNKNTLVAIWADSFPYEYLFRPTQENHKIMQELSLLPLGMTVYTPFFDQKMQKHGFTNIHTALQDSNTILIARPELLPAYQVFMKTYYGEEIVFDEVFEEPKILFFGWRVRRVDAD